MIKEEEEEEEEKVVVHYMVSFGCYPDPHKGPCNINKYGQCTHSYKWFCCCGYGLPSYYDYCNVKSCTRYKKLQSNKISI